jgi:hypothetical protein
MTPPQNVIECRTRRRNISFNPPCPHITKPTKQISNRASFMIVVNTKGRKKFTADSATAILRFVFSFVLVLRNAILPT